MYIYLFIDYFIAFFLSLCCACIFLCAIYLPSIDVCYWCVVINTCFFASLCVIVNPFKVVYHPVNCLLHSYFSLLARLFWEILFDFIILLKMAEYFSLCSGRLYSGQILASMASGPRNPKQIVLKRMTGKKDIQEQ